MNILIRNYSDEVIPVELVAMLQVYTLPEHYNQMVVGKPIVVDEGRGTKRQLKSPPVTITKQGNGNLCFDFSKL